MNHQEENYHEYPRSLLDSQNTFGQCLMSSNRNIDFDTRTIIHVTAPIKLLMVNTKNILENQRHTM